MLYVGVATSVWLDTIGSALAMPKPTVNLH